MKNIIILTCDGLTYNMVENDEHHIAPMEFVKSIRNKSIWCKKAYSQGPYTEAGIKGLLYGKMPLENGGYFTEHIAWEDSAFKNYYDAGYDIFCSYFSSYMPPEILVRGGYLYNTRYANPMLGRYLRGKLDYYYDIWKTKKINENDYKIIERLLERHFESIFLLYSKDAIENDCTGIYTPYDTTDENYCKVVEEGLAQLEKEQQEFRKNSRTYIQNIMSNYENHYLLDGCNWSAPLYTKDIMEQKDWLTREYSDFFKKLKKKNAWFILKNGKPEISEIITHVKYIFSKKTRQRGIEYFLRYAQSVACADNSKMIGKNHQQICGSAGAFTDGLVSWIKNRKQSTPFFAYIHFDEFHRPISFITHETLDKEVIRKEMREAEHYLDSLDKDYQGNVYFDLAAKYMDNKIKDLFDSLQEIGELENTIIVITADHGSSNCGQTPRFTSTNHFYEEQYHVPLIIYGAGEEEIDGFTNSPDILATLSELSGVKQHPSWIGSSVLNGGREYTTVEYAGGGVSDILRRPVRFGYRDTKKSFVVYGMINRPITEMSLEEYYNLIDDPKEIHNIATKISEGECLDCKLFFADRLQEIKTDYMAYLNSL